MRRTGWLCLALCLALPAQAEVRERTLGNGLKVVVKEDHRAPVVVQQIWYKTGSMDERSGVTGIAHVLEHMMFKGTRTVPGGEFSRRIAAAGGRENAFTSYDYTAYFQSLHASKLPLAMQLEADRMQNLQLRAEDFSKELKVVMEERRWRTDDNAQAVLQERMMATVFQQHAYHHPVIGWMSDLEQLKVEDARDWYRSWYAPNNATLVIAGDVQADAVFKLAQKYYGGIPARTLPARRGGAEPAQLGIKRLQVKAPAELPQLVMAYRAPVLRDPAHDWQPYALEVLAGVLDGNASARLNQVLVRDSRIASSVGAGYDMTARGPGLFILEATPAGNKSVAEVETALRAQIDTLVRDGIDAQELARVKAQVMAGQVYERDSVFYQAMQIGQTESLGLGHGAIPRMLEGLQAVTADQVREVARLVLQDDSLTVAVLDPQALDGKVKRIAAGGNSHVR